MTGRPAFFPLLSLTIPFMAYQGSNLQIRCPGKTMVSNQQELPMTTIYAQPGDLIHVVYGPKKNRKRKFSNYEKRCGKIILQHMTPGNLYANCEFERWLELGGEKRTGVGPTITYLRATGKILTTTPGQHMLMSTNRQRGR